MNNPSRTARVTHRLFYRYLSPGQTFTIIAFIIWLFIHGDYGITWDEPQNCSYGEAVRAYFFTPESFEHFSHLNFAPNAYFYGPLLSLVCAMISHATNADIFAVRHAVQGLFWVAMFFPVCALGRRIAGKAGAWCAGLALLGMPTLLGHAFNNPKDPPLACAAIWLLHLSIAAANARRLNWRHVLTLGAGIGFVLLMRPGAWFLCVLPGLVPLATAWRAFKGEDQRHILRKTLNTLPILVAAIAFGWVLMILPWPSALHSPVIFPIRAAFYAMHFDGIYPTIFRGSIYASNELPWDYLLTYLVLTLPLPLLLLGLWGQLVLWRKACLSISKRMAVLGTVFLFWFPMVMFIVMRPNIYDGMRHFLFILPAAAVMAGAAAADLIHRWPALHKTFAWPAAVLLLLSAVPAMIQMHPYESVFFNRLAGSRITLPSRYEIDYWLSSYREAALWLNGIQEKSSKPLSVAVASSDDSALPCLTHYLAPGIRVTRITFADYTHFQLPPEIDYYVATSRLDQWRNFPINPAVHVIERDGILLTVIRGKTGSASK